MSSNPDPSLVDGVLGSKSSEQVLQELNACIGSTAKMVYLKGLPTLTSLSTMFLARIQGALDKITATNHAIIHHRSNIDVRGRDLQIGGQPDCNYPDLIDSIRANSLLTARTINKIVKETEAHGGAVAYVGHQIPYVKSTGKRRGQHGELIVVVDDPRDGPHMVFNSASDVHVRGDGATVQDLLAARGTASPPGPKGLVELASSSEIPNNRISPVNVIDVVTLENWDQTFAEQMSKFEENNGIAYHTHGYSRIRLSQEELVSILRVRNIIEAARKERFASSLGYHVQRNSCIHFITSLLALAKGEEWRRACDQSFHGVAVFLATHADANWWNDKMGFRITHFIKVDGTLVDGNFNEVSLDDMHRAFKETFSSSAVLTSNSAARYSFDAQYNRACECTAAPMANELFTAVKDAEEAFLEEMASALDH